MFHVYVSFMFHRSLNCDLLISSFSSCFSDTGTKPPESGIFGFMINISALLGRYTLLGLTQKRNVN